MKVTVEQFLNAGFVFSAGDFITSPFFSEPREVGDEQAISCWNKPSPDDIDRGVFFCAWRKNTGSQPVPDDCPVILSLQNSEQPTFAKHVDWKKSGKALWKPDLEKLAKMLSEEKVDDALMAVNKKAIDAIKLLLDGWTSDAVYVGQNSKGQWYYYSETYSGASSVITDFDLIPGAIDTWFGRGFKKEYLESLLNNRIEKDGEKSESALDIGIKMHEKILGCDKKEWNGEGLPPVGEKVFYVDNPKFNAKDQVIEKWENGDELKVIAADMCWGALLPVVRNSRTQGVSFIRLELIESKERFTERLTKRNEAGRELHGLLFNRLPKDERVYCWDDLPESTREAWREVAERVTVNDWSDDDLPY